MSNLKKCPICNKNKPINDYHTYFSKSRGKIRIGNYCKPCAKVSANRRAKEYYKLNKETRLVYAKLYRNDPKNKLIIKEKKAEFVKKYRATLHDCYAAEICARMLKKDITTVRANPELLEVYKQNLKIKRKIKSLKNG
jgi:hypothetical protein